MSSLAPPTPPHSRIPRSPAHLRLPGAPRPRTTIFSSPGQSPHINLRFGGSGSVRMKGKLSSPYKQPKKEPQRQLKALLLVEKYHGPVNTEKGLQKEDVKGEGGPKPSAKPAAIGKENGRTSGIPRTTRLSTAPASSNSNSTSNFSANFMSPILKPKLRHAKTASIRVKARSRPKVMADVCPTPPVEKVQAKTVSPAKKMHRPKTSITTGMKGLSLSMRGTRGKGKKARPSLVIPPPVSPPRDTKPSSPARLPGSPTSADSMRSFTFPGTSPARSTASVRSTKSVGSGEVLSATRSPISVKSSPQNVKVSLPSPPSRTASMLIPVASPVQEPSLDSPPSKSPSLTPVSPTSLVSPISPISPMSPPLYASPSLAPASQPPPQPTQPPLISYLSSLPSSSSSSASLPRSDSELSQAPRRKIVVPAFLDTLAGPRDAKIRNELEMLRARRKVQGGPGQASGAMAV